MEIYKCYCDKCGKELALIAENERRLYFAGREGTKTERKRDKKFSNYMSRNCK